MKKYKLIFGLWLCAIVVVVPIFGVLVYNNAYEGEIALKELAVTNLQEVAEHVVNREFDNLGMAYYILDNKKSYTKRQTITTEGLFEVQIDSLKESQGLYSLETVGYKANILNSLTKFPLEQIEYEWRTKMEERYSGMLCSLSLKIKSLGENVEQKVFVGDTTICKTGNEIGVYYLDDMYTMILAAYIIPTYWSCIDWTSPWLFSISCLLFLLLVGLFVRIALQKYKKAKIVEIFTEEIYQFGEYSFNAVQHTLLYKGDKKTDCTLQEARLLLAFAKAQDFILTNDEIDIICGWKLGETGIDTRRRKMISNMRKLFNDDDSVEFVALDEKGGYQIVISL